MVLFRAGPNPMNAYSNLPIGTLDNLLSWERDAFQDTCLSLLFAVVLVMWPYLELVVA